MSIDTCRYAFKSKWVLKMGDQMGAKKKQMSLEAYFEKEWNPKKNNMEVVN